MTVGSERPREREVDRYYQPWLETFHSSDLETIDIPKNFNTDGHVPRSSKDKTLTAFAQLGCLRLGAKRGIVTLISGSQQYILAEATRSLSLMDDAIHAADDELWFGNAVIPRNQGISEDAMFPPVYHAQAADGASYSTPALIVQDITKSEKYQNRGYAGVGVTFYAGVPIITRSGHVIGVYTVTDDQPRDGLTAEHVRFMVDMADIVVNHLEVIKNDRARARGERLIQGIGTFIEGDVTEEPQTDSHTLLFPSDDSKAESSEQPNLKTEKRPGVSRRHTSTSSFKGLTISDANAFNKEKKSDRGNKHNDRIRIEEAKSVLAPTQTQGESQATEKTISSHNHEDLTSRDLAKNDRTTSPHARVFDRAARILRQCMGADGVVFLDASSANRSRGTVNHHRGDSSTAVIDYSKKKSRSSFGNTNDHNLEVNSKLETKDDNQGSTTDSTGSDDQETSNSPESRSQVKSPSCEIFGLALKPGYSGSQYTMLEREHRRLVVKNPRGHCYYFDERGRIASSDESSETGAAHSEMIPLQNGETQEHNNDAKTSSAGVKRKRSPLLRAFHKARTVVFLPLWDYPRQRWHSGAFIWSANPLTNVQEDLSYIRAFGHSVMNEIARLDLSYSDTAKGTFLANISHELRSPLHGILGSIEFLHDTAMDDFQSSMVIAVETCGKTLLDTVNHVLDYAKMNNLSKQLVKNSNRPADNALSQATDSKDNLTEVFDLAVVVEEVVEAVYAGQVFRTATKDAWQNHGPSKSASDRAMEKRQDTRDQIVAGAMTSDTAVKLTLNIDAGISWRVMTQPGAIRRVTMNLLGNSLKYTGHGSINIALEVDKSRKKDASLLHVCMTVTDTGRGMSDDYVRNHAFTAFSQEDSLATGTGLGLSIIRQIVDSLGGKIDLKSQKDLGTEIKIWLSLPKAPESDPGEVTLLTQIRERTRGMSICMLDPTVKERHHTDTVLGLRPMPTVADCMRKLVADWFDMKVISAETMANVDTDFFIFAEPPPIEYLLDNAGNTFEGKDIPVIIMCANAFEASSLRANGLHTLVDIGRILEIISQPCGPQKLSKVLQRCLQRIEKMKSGSERHGSQHVTLSLNGNDDLISNLDKGDLDLTRHLRREEESTSQSHTTTEEEEESGKSSPIRRDLRIDTASRSPMSSPLLGPASPISTSTMDENADHVLVVDDNHINLHLLITFVRKTKHPYQSATNGQEALENYKNSCQEGQEASRLRFIFMDINMPVMNGLTATKEIRKFERENNIHPPAVIIALTGLGNQTDQKEALDCGFDKFLSKPIRFRDLEKLLKNK